MNKLTIIGNLTKDPELRTTTTGKNVCSFTVAVNRRRKNNEQQEADYFNVSAWNERAELCKKYLEKGKKVCVVGSVSVRQYQTQDGKHGASLEVAMDDIEFVSPKGEQKHVDPQSGYEQVDPADLPY